MYISNMTHFLDEQGNIAKQMPKEARELGSFFALVVDTTTTINPKRLTATGIRCFEKDVREQRGLNSYLQSKKFTGCAHGVKMKAE